MAAKRREPRWLTAVQIRILRAEIIKLFDERDCLRDAAMLESASDAPRNRFAHEDDSGISDLAETLGQGIIRNHPFVDGDNAWRCSRCARFCSRTQTASKR